MTDRFHGLRFAPPVATTLRPAGARGPAADLAWAIDGDLGGDEAAAGVADEDGPAGVALCEKWADGGGLFGEADHGVAARAAVDIDQGG